MRSGGALLLPLLAVAKAAADCVPTPATTFDLYVFTGYSKSIAADATGGRGRTIVTSSFSNEVSTSSIPGPEFRVKVGDCVLVNVHNYMYGEPVSVHYHGINQKGTPWADGTAFISECPGHSMSVVPHQFTVDEPGTYFYHSHNANQMADGLYGAFIVEDPTSLNTTSNSVCFPPGGSYCVSNTNYHESTVIVSDWWTEDSRAQIAELTNKPFTWQGEPQAILINGKSTNNATLAQTIPVTAGHTYRIRLICANSLSYIRWAVEGHNVTIVAADGGYVLPKPNQPFVECQSGQRYDVLLTADQAPGAYWMTAVPRYRVLSAYGSARVVYDTAPGGLTSLPASNVTTIANALPISLAPSTETNNTVLKQVSLAAIPVSLPFVSGFQGVKPPPKQTPTVNLVYTLNQQLMSRDGLTSVTPYLGSTESFAGNKSASAYIRWALNNASYVLEDTPALLAAYTGLFSDPNSAYQPHPLTVNIKSGDYVQVVLSNGIALNGRSEAHPFHLHGHSFWVVGSGVGLYDPAKDGPGLDSVLAPLYRDTVVLLPYTWVAIRFLADNPGAWGYHCHASAHFSLLGMGMVFVEGADQIPAPPNGTAICGRVSADITKKETLQLQQGYYATHLAKEVKPQ